MSTMSDAIETAMGKLMEFAADTGIFIPDGGAPIPVQIRLDKGDHIEPDGYTTAVAGKEIRIKALISEIVTEPNCKTPNESGDIFTVGGVSYEVITIVERDNYFITCAVREL